MTNAEYTNLCNWCKAIHDQGKAIYNRQTEILKELSRMSASLDALKGEVTALQNAATAAVDLLDKLAGVIAGLSNGATAEQLAEVTTRLTAIKDQLNAGVAKDTPAT